MARKKNTPGEFLTKLRAYHGLSRADLSRAIQDKGVAAGWPKSRVHVSPDSLRLIEEGHEPGPRIKFAIALYCEMRPGQIWEGDDFDGPLPAPARPPENAAPQVVV